jgi:ribosomal protein S18 acetylase RimI-like enzyme
VVDAGAGPVGYLVAVSDTPAFVTWWRDTWAPWFATAHPHPEPPFSPEDKLVLRGYRPDVLLIAEVADYPAHLHIDLLPEAQGAGWGRALIDTLRGELDRVDVPGVSVSLDPANTAARAFYDRLGYVELGSSTAEQPVLGLLTTP